MSGCSRAGICFRTCLSAMIAVLAINNGCGRSTVPTPVDASSRIIPGEPSSENKASTKAAADASSGERMVIDGLKRKVTLPRRPERIVSLAPKNTEELFAIGAGDRVVGVTSYCNFPPEARQRDQIGGFSSKSISLEKVISLRPDLVLSAGDFHRPVIDELERLQVPVVALAAETVDELYQEIEMLGLLVGQEQRAEDLVTQMQRRIQRVRQTATTIPPDARAAVFYMTWDDPLTAAGPGSYAGQLLELCGAENVISDVGARYPQISHEVLLSRNPDVIIAAAMTDERWTVESLRAKTGWRELKAVQQGRLYLLDGDAVSRCGPRLVEVLETMAHMLYPDRYPPPSREPAAGQPDVDREYRP